MAARELPDSDAVMVMPLFLMSTTPRGNPACGARFR